MAGLSELAGLLDRFTELPFRQQTEALERLAFLSGRVPEIARDPGWLADEALRFRSALSGGRTAQLDAGRIGALRGFVRVGELDRGGESQAEGRFAGTLAISRPPTPISSILLWPLHPKTRADWEGHLRQFGYGPHTFSLPERHAAFLDERLATALNFIKGFSELGDEAFLRVEAMVLNSARTAQDILEIVHCPGVLEAPLGRHFWKRFAPRSDVIEVAEVARNTRLMAALSGETRDRLVAVGRMIEEGIRREFLRTVAALGNREVPNPPGQRVVDLGPVDPLRFFVEEDPRDRLVCLDIVDRVSPVGPEVLLNGRFLRDEREFGETFTLHLPRPGERGDRPIIAEANIVSPSLGDRSVWRARVARMASLAAALGATDFEIANATWDAEGLRSELGLDSNRFSLQRNSPIWMRLAPVALLNDCIASLELGRISSEGAAEIRRALHQMAWAAGVMPESPVFNAFWRGLASQTRGRIAEIVSKVQTG